MIHPRADRCRAGAVGLERKLGLALKHAVHVAAEHVSVVRGGDVVPLADRMQLVAKSRARSYARRPATNASKAPLLAVDDDVFRTGSGRSRPVCRCRQSA